MIIIMIIIIISNKNIRTKIIMINITLTKEISIIDKNKYNNMKNIIKCIDSKLLSYERCT